MTFNVGTQCLSITLLNLIDLNYPMVEHVNDDGTCGMNSELWVVGFIGNRPSLEYG